MNPIRFGRDYEETPFGLPVMSTLGQIAKLFSTTPSALRAGLLGFGLAFAATDPNLAAVGKAATAVSPAVAHAETARALVVLNPVAALPAR